MTRNVTLRMDEDLLAELRHRAVDAHMSLSAWITSTIQSVLPRVSEIDEVREQAIKRLEHGFHLGGTPLSREDIHAR
jgi:hypothetical protein